MSDKWRQVSAEERDEQLIVMDLAPARAQVHLDPDGDALEIASALRRFAGVLEKCSV